MTRIVDAASVPRADRLEFIHRFVDRVLPVDVDFGANDPKMRASVTQLGSVQISSIKSNAISVHRAAVRAQDDFPPSVSIALQIRGSCLVVQDGREVVIKPGDLCIRRSDAPYTALDSEGYYRHQVLVPMDRLAVPTGLVQQLTATRLCPGHPIADLAATYFYRLASQAGALATAGADLTSQPSLELVRALIGTHLDQTGPEANESAHAVLHLRILEYVRANLHDPGLCAQQIATAHHISVRHLYKVLGEHQIALGDWIRTRRLEACRDQLARPISRQMTIAAVGRQWGFPDPTNFGRQFRIEYGMSPRQWRDQAAHARG